MHNRARPLLRVHELSPHGVSIRKLPLEDDVRARARERRAARRRLAAVQRVDERREGEGSALHGG